MSFLNELKKLDENNAESLGLLADAQDLVDKFLADGESGPRNLIQAATSKIPVLAAVEIISRVPWQCRVEAMQALNEMWVSSMRLLKEQLITEAVESTLQMAGEGPTGVLVVDLGPRKANDQPPEA